MNNYPKILITTFICLFFALSLSAQRGVKLGDKYLNNFDFISAIEEYKKTIDKDRENIKAVQGLAIAYRYTGNFAESEAWYGKLLELDSGNPENRFFYSQALRSTKKYDKALESWEAYRTEGNNDYVSGIIDGFDYIDDLSKPNSNVELKNASSLNTANSDFGVSFKNLAEIVFVSTREDAIGEQDNWTHGQYADLYSSVVAPEEQSAPQKFADNQYNGMYHDGPAVFNGDIMYLTRSHYKKGKTYKSKSDKTVKLELVEVNLNERSSKLKKFAKDFDFNNKEYSVGHAAVSYDGSIIIFSSDSEEFGNSYGGTDLYMITKKGDEWSTPINLGMTINTPADEEYPFFSAQNEIYFASDGHYGLGGLDIYSSHFNGEEWSTPDNIGAPFNTSFDDFNYVYNEEAGFGFVSSNRPGGMGSDDIYTFKYKDGKRKTNNSVMVKVLTYDEETLEPLEAVTFDILKCMEGTYLSDEKGRGSLVIDPMSACKLNARLDGFFPKEIPFNVFEDDIEIAVPLRRVADNTCELTVCVTDRNMGTPVDKASIKVMSEVEGVFFTGLTDETGCFTFEGIIGNNDYELVASREIIEPESKFLSTTSTYSTAGVECPSEMKTGMTLDFVQLGSTYLIENIYYDLDKFFIREDAKDELDHIVNLMKSNPTLEIELGSHTDCRNTADYNQELSNNRAKAAVDYIVSTGVEEYRLTYKGYGESQLVNNCACECDKALGLSNFIDCENEQVTDCSDEQHQENRRTEFKITKF
ncbi:MAG: outer membrane protein OmpA-like peptidoglycan-associated protein [Chitinophagales bacterium]|jgi:outer membrane protein OmpA-like peptidoglycan-associated protein/tetratricopeptide (TPR) repeat protein